MQLLSIVQPMKMLLTCFTHPFDSIHAEIFNWLKERAQWRSAEYSNCFGVSIDDFLQCRFNSHLQLACYTGNLEIITLHQRTKTKYVSIKCLFVTWVWMFTFSRTLRALEFITVHVWIWIHFSINVKLLKFKCSFHGF